MKKTLLLAGVLALGLGNTMQAQDLMPLDRKWDPKIENLLKNRQTVSRASTDEPLQELIISSSDPEKVATMIGAQGYTAQVVGTSVLTAKVPLSNIVGLAEMEEVNYMSVPRQFSPLMHTTREMTRVDEIHAGEGLETPFTGEGVIVGVIDQGFEYKHIAFQDASKKTRVLAVWNRNTQKLSKTIPSAGDGFNNSKGHGAHVANIAAGSKIADSKYYGIAYNADLILASSTFGEDDVINSIDAIKDFAEKEGKPFVINMSFGGQIGPHDGSSAYDQAMGGMSKSGGLLVAAMGNEGEDNIHASYTFKKEGETKYVIFELPTNTDVNLYAIDLWGTNGDGKQHLKVRPFVFNKITKAKDFKTASFWTNCGSISANINPYNKKENYNYMISVNSMQSGSSNKVVMGLEITGNEGDGFNVWSNPGYGSISTTIAGSSYLKGDNLYCVSEGAATAPNVIAVASYNGNNGSFYSYNEKASYTYNSLKNKGALSPFSSRGPWLGGDGMKPTIAAPGSVISSAFNKYSTAFSKEDIEITDILSSGASKYYYGVMSGTSMATPAVTGILALWLEANPELTYDEVLAIFKKTAIKDNYTGKEDWNEEFGHGKIDAYAGLLEVLKMAENVGINDLLNSESPVTLKKGHRQWNILFNNDESFADIKLYTAAGKQVMSRHLENVRRGEETIVDLSTCEAGVYVIRIQTTLGDYTRKVMVK